MPSAPSFTAPPRGPTRITSTSSGREAPRSGRRWRSGTTCGSIPRWRVRTSASSASWRHCTARRPSTRARPTPTRRRSSSPGSPRQGSRRAFRELGHERSGLVQGRLASASQRRRVEQGAEERTSDGYGFSSQSHSSCVAEMSLMSSSANGTSSHPRTLMRNPESMTAWGNTRPSRRVIRTTVYPIPLSGSFLTGSRHLPENLKTPALMPPA